MPEQLIELSDTAFRALQEIADRMGLSVEEAASRLALEELKRRDLEQNPQAKVYELPKRKKT